MDPFHNPFAPGAGSPPPELSGRSDLLERGRIALGRVKAGRSEKGLILVGLRGVGKTVLLNEIRQRATDMNYAICSVEAHESKPLAALLVPQLRRVLIELDRAEQLSTQVKRALRVFRGFVGALRVKISDIEMGMDIDPEPGVADSGDLEVDLPDMFAELGKAAAARGRAIGLFIDEIQYCSTVELSALIMAVHRASQGRLPVALFAAGLPQVVSLFGRSKSYAERLFDFPLIGPLGLEDASNALQRPAAHANVRFDSAAMKAIQQQTLGYPFFLQEWGYHSWNQAEASPIGRAAVDRATKIAISRLDEGFFRVRFDRLTPREKDYLRAMAEIGEGPHRSGDVAKMLNKRTSDLGLLREGLIAKGMIYAPAHGDLAFTVPLFDLFLRRIIPDFRPEKIRGGTTPPNK